MKQHSLQRGYQQRQTKKSLASKTRIVLGRSRSRGACGYSIDAAFPGYQNIQESGIIIRLDESLIVNRFEINI